jgi:trimeric autotransporter adhesin
MRYCQKVHDLRQCPVAVGSPQTQTQCNQVARIISVAQGQALTAQRRLNQKTAEISSLTETRAAEVTVAEASAFTTGEGQSDEKREVVNSNTTDLASYSSSSSMNETSDGNSHVKKARSLSDNLNNLDTQQPQKYRVVETENSIQSEPSSTKPSPAAAPNTIPALQTRKNSSTKLPGPPLTLLTTAVATGTQQSNKEKKSAPSSSKSSDLSLTSIVPHQHSTPPHLSSQSPAHTKKSDPLSTKNEHFQFTPTPPSSTSSTPSSTSSSFSSSLAKKLSSHNAMRKENEMTVTVGAGTTVGAGGVASPHPQPPKDRHRGSSSTNKGSVKDSRKLSFTGSGNGNGSTLSPSTDKKEKETSPATTATAAAVRVPLTQIINSTTHTQQQHSSPVVAAATSVTSTPTDCCHHPSLFNDHDRRNLSSDLDHEIRLEVLTDLHCNEKVDEFRVACAPLVSASCNN